MRQSALAHFTWGRPTGPARIEKVRKWNFGDARDPRFRAVVFGPFDESGQRGYEPMSEPLIFSDFGRLAQTPTPDAMAGFATRWGPLTTPLTGVMIAGDNPTDYFDAEPLGIWRQEVEAFGEAYKLWALLSAREPRDLRSIEALLEEIMEPRLEEIREPRSRDELSRAGWLLFDERVNHHLVRLRVGPRLFFNVETRYPALRISPKSLIGAIWLQLAEAADRSYAALRCPRCEKWFSRNPKSKSRKHKYCSTACRMAMYRRGVKARASTKNRRP